MGYNKFQYIREEILTPLGLKNTYGSINEVNPDDVMSGYYVGIEEDLKNSAYGSKLTSMIASAEDVGIFLRALNDGSLFEEGEQEIYSSIYVYNHTGLIPGYQSIAKYHKKIDAAVIQFTNTTNFNAKIGYLINPSYNLSFSIGINYHSQNFYNFGVLNNQTNYVYFSFKTNLYNQYYDF